MGDAVNQSVVITFLLLFAVNLVITALYFQLVPPKGRDGAAHDGRPDQGRRPPRPAGGVPAAAGTSTSWATSSSFYARALAWTPRTLRRYKREMLRLLAEVTFGTGALAVIGGTVGVIASDPLHRHRGRPPGLRGAGPARHLGLHRLHLGVLQHPGDRPAGRRAGPVGDRRRRVHRAARRDAHQRGGRRAGGHGGALAAVPGHHPDDRRLRRHHPAVRDRPADQLLRDARSSPPWSTGSRRAPTTTTSSCSSRRRTCCGRSSRCSSSRRDHPDPLLLRLPGQRRPGGRGYGRRPRGALLHRA